MLLRLSILKSYHAQNPDCKNRKSEPDVLFSFLHPYTQNSYVFILFLILKLVFMYPIMIYIQYLIIFFKGSKSCSYLYPPKNNENDQLPEATDGQFEGFRRIEHNVRKKLTETLNQDLQGAIVRQSLVAGGLCMALSYVNRYFRQREGRKARILVLTASGSTSFHYMNYMNAFFTAQRLGVPIDTCVLECDSGLLQQGADITGKYLFGRQNSGNHNCFFSAHFPQLFNVYCYEYK